MHPAQDARAVRGRHEARAGAEVGQVAGDRSERPPAPDLGVPSATVTPVLGDLVDGVRFLPRLPGFLRHPVTVAEARATLDHRLRHREIDFLALARRAIYDHPASPYRALLQVAGCEHGDLARLVLHEGLEGALGTLLRHGVYLTVDELKGRRPVVRGSVRLTLGAGSVRSPLTSAHLASHTGGSRGPRAAVGLDLAFLRDVGADVALVAEARGEHDAAYAVWTVPGGDALTKVLRFAAAGLHVGGWFWQVDPGEPGLAAAYRWSALATGAGSRLGGRSLPWPALAPIDDPAAILRWMAETRRQGRTPHLQAYASPIVRLCQAATAAGVDLGGARFTAGAEPVTPARLAVVRATGAVLYPHYSSVDSGPMGMACLAPAAADDVHVLEDRHALIQAGEAVRFLPAQALLVTSLRPTAPQVLLNVSLGDQAVLERRACGCALEGLGWRTHLHTIRSFEKLTAGGMSFLDVDVIRVLEEVLPARFGGQPTDYQLVEQEDEAGRPAVRLLAHPRLGSLDERALADTFLDSIGAGSGAERVMELAWREAGVLTVRRRPPFTTPAGKILHLHSQRTAAPARLGA